MAWIVPFVLLQQLLYVGLLLIPSVSGADVDGFWSVNCGSATPFIDPTTKLTWHADTEYVHTGDRHSMTPTLSVGRELTTLMAFPPPWPRKNCFTFYIGDGLQILVRAYFYYGNYDGRGKPPSFLLEFDGNAWTTVVTTMNSVVTHQVIYFTQSDISSICLSRTDPEQHPFISAIEVRKPGKIMNHGIDRYHALYPKRFVAFGATQQFRYPDDPYDRIWTPSTKEQEGFSYTLLTSNSTTVNTSTDADNPPKRLFMGAAAPLGGAGSNLSISFRYLPAGTINQIYVLYYFTEVAHLTSFDKRSFNTYFDGKKTNTEPIVPSSGKISGYYNIMENVTKSLRFDIVSDDTATLPPTISGLEVLIVSNPVSNGTNQDDVDTMKALQKAFNVLGNWTGDPCLPVGSNWEWVGCKVEEYSARITKLLLGDYNLTGTIPDFSALEYLDTVDLHGNHFKGSIPTFLGDLTHLTNLNLADNDFSEIPASILNNTNLLFNYTGNPKLCKPGQLCLESGRNQTVTTDGQPTAIKNGSPSSRIYLRNLVLLCLVTLFTPVLI